MQLLQAKPIKEKIYSDLKNNLSDLIKKKNIHPKLVVVLVGNDPASIIYTSNKGKAAESIGMLHETIHFPATVLSKEVKEKILSLNNDPSVHGILIQRPLPKIFNEEDVLYWISPHKDVDAFHPENVGKLSLGLPCFEPCTPSGVMKILNYYKIPIQGKTACVIGRSSIVGKPMQTLLLQANATVIQCHSKTTDLASFTKQADILVAAAGVPELIHAQHIKKGAVVIDVGIHKKENGKLCGDVHFESVSPLCSAITPVPGGVGPMTIATLLQNTYQSAVMRCID